MTPSAIPSRFAIAAAIVLFAVGMALTPASAADLGGDCCADLEERVVELEATTVRKGNRKVSVKLSGQVNRAVMWWDDGDEQNAYVVDNDYSSTRFRFTGDADWKPGWKIGFALEWEQQDEASNVQTAIDDDVNGGFNVRQAHWWVKSDRLGKLRVGQISSASDAVSEVNLSGATVVSGSLMGALFNGFRLVNNVAQTTPTGARSFTANWADFISNFDGLGRQDGVRYDSPTFAGFTLSAGWYEDDAWDVALRFAKQWNSVLFAAAIGYAEDREGLLAFCSEPNFADPTFRQNGANDGGADCSQLSGSLSILHQPTGLFATFAAGKGEDDTRQTSAISFANAAYATNGFSVDDDADFWYANAGINRRFNAHGKTSIGVEYMEVNCGFGGCDESFNDLNATPASNRAVFFNGVDQGAQHHLAETEVEAWGVWLVQNIDNAATEFYIAYQHAEFDATAVNAITGQTVAVSDSIEDMDVFVAGARIKF